MKWILAASLMAGMILASGCARPVRASSTQTHPYVIPTTNGAGILVFPEGWTFAPGCAHFEQAISFVTGSSELTVSWDRDTLGTAAAQIDSVRPSADVGTGETYFVVCNFGPSAVTVPAEASAMYQVLN